MSCCRNRNRDRDRDDVFGIQRIALRGPGCIDGTGRCRGVLGTGGRRRCEDLLDAAEDFCDEVFGDRGRRCCSNVLGTGGERFHCSNSDLLGIRDRDSGVKTGVSWVPEKRSGAVKCSGPEADSSTQTWQVPEADAAGADVYPHAWI